MTGKARMTALILALVFALAHMAALADVGERFQDTALPNILWFEVTSEAPRTVMVIATTSTATYAGTISIPDSVTTATGTYAVTAIDNAAFAYCASLTGVTIPDSVTIIGGGAFYSCGSLTGVIIPDSVTSIGPNAFEACGSLTSVTIGSGVTNIDSNAFLYCTGLTSVTIPDSVTSIGTGTFAYCASLTSVTIGRGVTDIGSNAFATCTNLKSMTFLGSNPPNNIEPNAFQGVNGPVTVYVPYGSEQAYTNAFTIAGITLPAGSTFVAMPLPSSRGSGWYPPDPVSSTTPTTPTSAFPTQGAVTAKRVNAYVKDTLKGKVIFRMSKGAAFTILGLSKKALRIEYGGNEGYIAIRDIQATFGAALRGTALKKAGAYVLWEENGKMTREGYFPKGLKLPIHGIEGGYLIYNSAAGTYYLKAGEWRIEN